MSIQQKNSALLIGFVLILVLSYIFSISDTLKLKQNYQSMKEQETLSTSIPQRLHVLKQKEKHYDSLLQHYQISETSLQNNLLKTIERYAIGHDIKVVSFESPHNILQNKRKVNSYIFTVEGDFTSILGLAYQLEQRSKFGMVASLDIEKQKEYRTGRESLQGTFILQLVQ